MIRELMRRTLAQQIRKSREHGWRYAGVPEGVIPRLHEIYQITAQPSQSQVIKELSGLGITVDSSYELTAVTSRIWRHHPELTQVVWEWVRDSLRGSNRPLVEYWEDSQGY